MIQAGGCAADYARMAYMHGRPDDLPWDEAVAPSQRILAVGLYAATGLSARGILVRLAAQAQAHAQDDFGDGADPDSRRLIRKRPLVAPQPGRSFSSRF